MLVVMESDQSFSMFILLIAVGLFLILLDSGKHD